MRPLYTPLTPYEDEPLVGFVGRTASEYQFRNPMRLLRPVDLGITRLGALAKGNPENLERLREYLGLTSDEMARMRYATDDGKCQVMGHEVSADFVTTGRRRACPRCLEEAPYHRAVWDIAPMTACVVHGVMLLDRCPACHKRLQWTYGSAVHCGNRRCTQGDLSRHEAEPVRAADMAGIMALDKLFREGAPVQTGPIAKLPVGEVMRLAFHLGCIATGTRMLERPRALADRDPGRMPRLLTEGWQACQSWPNGLYRILDRLRHDTAQRPGRYGVRKVFGSLPSWVHRVASEPYGAVLAVSVAEFAASVPGFASRVKQVRARQQAGLTPQLSMAKAAKRVGVASVRLRNLAVKRGLFTLAPTGKGAPALLSEELVESLAAGLARHVTKQDAKRILGIGRHGIDSLLEAGLVVPVDAPELRENAKYAVTDLEALIQAVGKHATLTAESRPARSISLLRATQQLGPHGVGLDDFVRSAIAGDIVPVFVDSRRRGISRYLYSFDDVKRVAVAVTTSQVKATMSVDAAAKRLGVKQEVAYHWARRGILETVRVDAERENGMRVTEQALEKFQAEYVTGTEVAAEMGMRARWVSVALERRGIRPVSGPSVDGGRQLLFRRADVIDVRPASLVSGASKMVSRPSTSSIRAQGSALAGRIVTAVEPGFGMVDRKSGRLFEMASGASLMVMVARNEGLLGTYVYVLMTQAKAKMERASDGRIVLGFLDRNEALLLPWSDVVAGLGPVDKKGYWSIRVDFDVGGDPVVRPTCSWSRMAI